MYYKTYTETMLPMTITAPDIYLSLKHRQKRVFLKKQRFLVPISVRNPYLGYAIDDTVQVDTQRACILRFRVGQSLPRMARIVYGLIRICSKIEEHDCLEVHIKYLCLDA